MSTTSSSSSRRRLLATWAAASAFGLVLLAAFSQARTVPAAEQPTASGRSPVPDPSGIRPFHVKVSDAELIDLRRRIAATRWPDRETVNDRSQGVQLGKFQELVRYWGTGYDWRKVEAKLNALPQFVTTIDGVDIHFIHVRSRHPNSMALIVTHGWPGSVIEFLKVIDPLTNPTAHGGRAEDAFDLIIPSIPGYAFSGKPQGTGWDPDHIARAWAELMKRLGYTRYVAQGGDWGAPISSAMARQAPPGLLGIHLNLPATVPPEVAAALAGGPAPAGLSEKERAVLDALVTYNKSGSSAYFTMLTARPQAVGYGLTDSPAGLAAFMLVHPGFAQWTYGDDPGKSPTKDEVLDDITLYWLTNSATSAARLYWENRGRGSVILAAAQKTAEISLPVAITVFPEDVYRPPETWARRAYRNLIYFHEVDRGGHFAAWEQPELFAAEIRAAFRPLRKAGTDVARPIEKGGSRETGSAGTSGTGSSGAGQTSPSTPSGTQH
jgi:pimeloyl-ACP methyl ester carboxylesterase